jgi:hypothetical protein
MCVHMPARINSRACICVCLRVLRAESVESDMFLHLSRELYRSRAERFKQCTHLSACIESLACSCICWFVLGAGCEPSCVGQYPKLRRSCMSQHSSSHHDAACNFCPYREVSVYFVCFFFFRIQEPGMQAQVLARIKAQHALARVGPC